METKTAQEKKLRGPRKYSLEISLKAKEYKEKGLNNKEICKLLGIKHKMQLRRILIYPYEKVPIRDESRERKKT